MAAERSKDRNKKQTEGRCQCHQPSMQLALTILQIQQWALSLEIEKARKQERLLEIA
jgi:hypothetical protein